MVRKPIQNTKLKIKKTHENISSKPNAFSNQKKKIKSTSRFSNPKRKLPITESLAHGDPERLLGCFNLHFTDIDLVSARGLIPQARTTTLSGLITALPSKPPTLSFLLLIQLYSREEKNTMNNTKNNILPFLLGSISVSHLPLPRNSKASSETQSHNSIGIYQSCG